MSLYNVSTGAVINANDLNQVVNVLAQQPGGQEIGKYFLSGGTTQSGWIVSNWIITRSYGSMPVSVTMDTSTTLAAGAGTPAGQNITNSGFQAIFGATFGSNTARAGGNYTVQY